MENTDNPFNASIPSSCMAFNHMYTRKYNLYRWEKISKLKRKITLICHIREWKIDAPVSHTFPSINSSPCCQRKWKEFTSKEDGLIQRWFRRRKQITHFPQVLKCLILIAGTNFHQPTTQITHFPQLIYHHESPFISFDQYVTKINR